MTTVLAAAGVLPAPPGPGWVAIDDGRIVEVGAGSPPAGARDLGDAVLAPGYVDLQVNGIADVDLRAADAAGWRRAGATLLRHGVTTCCPTFVTAPLDEYDGALDRLTAAMDTASDDPSVAAIAGAHLEGPFLGEAPGAHPAELIRAVDLPWIDALLAAHPGAVAIVTLAPEADPGFAATRALVAAGIVVALGHSRADHATALAAADAGATVVTHLFNAMGALHHREPGLAGAALDDPRLVPTLIADGVHVHPALTRFVVTSGRDVALVSDAVAAGPGLDVTGGAARLPDGTLAGATALLDDAVRMLVAGAVPLARAVACASEIPARLLRLSDRGRIEAGRRADLLALDPGTASVRQVWREGVPAGARPGEG